jgi:enoyl-CoA hydratase/carnithine racemase
VPDRRDPASAFVVTTRERGARVVTLTSPRARNALDAGLVRALRTLRRERTDTDVVPPLY